MKKLIYITMIAATTVFAANSAHAQLQKGNLMVGADLADMNLSFQSGNTDFSLSISPKLGYFIQDNIAIGGEVKLGIDASKGFTQFNYGVGAFGRYYVSDPRAILLKHTRFFAEASVGVSGLNTHTKVDGVSVSTNTNGLGIGVGPGVAYFITPNIGLEALLKYNLTVGFGNSTTINNLSFGLGFQIYLPTKKARQVYGDVKDEVNTKMKRNKKSASEDED